MSHSAEIRCQATQSQRPSPSMMNRGHRGRVVRGGRSGDTVKELTLVMVVV